MRGDILPFNLFRRFDPAVSTQVLPQNKVKSQKRNSCRMADHSVFSVVAICKREQESKKNRTHDLDQECKIQEKNDND